MSGSHSPGSDDAARESSGVGEGTGETEIYSQAYSAPESEHFTIAPYVPPEPALYDYDSYEAKPDADDAPPPRWPWVVGVVAIIAAISLVASVAILVTRNTSSENVATPSTSTTSAPPTGPRYVTYRIWGTKAPLDRISVTYTDAAGRQRTQQNVYIPWMITLTPISMSDVGSVQASSLLRLSHLNCSIVTSDGQTLASQTNDDWQTSC
ncbi:MmpS family transport accessory protein [Mycolicibacterium mucogenicum]|uniref:MmpS family transport accessory protein n=1 Tax=Mycolicibacterium mucogenicum TaxID=56689 RepID=UPI00226AAE8A|nr:MmpS family transport accessory protein [Mycolicibacterium mucogenicum]MCX8556993.1 MmpS family transport accessory protein [Mycolicibacterium mucogenicum]